MSAFDSTLMFRTTGDLSASESCGPVVVYGTPMRGMAVRVEVPKANGANDTVLPRLYASADNSTYNLIASYQEGAVKPYGGKTLILPFAVKSGEKVYLKLELVVTAASTTSDFGGVRAGIVMGGGAKIDRSTHWS